MSITYREPTFKAVKKALATLDDDSLGRLADVLQAVWSARDEGKAGEAVMDELPSILALAKAFPEALRVLLESATLADGKPKADGWLDDEPLSVFVGHAAGLAKSDAFSPLVETVKNLMPPATNAGGTSGI